MKIAIIGTGNVGGALATGWAKAGHQIFLGVQNTSDFKGKHLLENDNTTVHTVSEAAAAAEVILVATPPQIAGDLAKAFGDCEGKVIIDATNALRAKPEPYETAYHAFAALTKAEVVKCFNSTGFENMENPNRKALKADMFYAGASTKAKEVADKLAKEIGFESCYDFGGEDKVKLLEHFAFSWINLAIMQGYGRDIVFKVL